VLVVEIWSKSKVRRYISYWYSICKNQIQLASIEKNGTKIECINSNKRLNFLFSKMIEKEQIILGLMVQFFGSKYMLPKKAKFLQNISFLFQNERKRNLFSKCMHM
jgi:hypothetical protein